MPDSLKDVNLWIGLIAFVTTVAAWFHGRGRQDQTVLTDIQNLKALTDSHTRDIDQLKVLLAEHTSNTQRTIQKIELMYETHTKNFDTFRVNDEAYKERNMKTHEWIAKLHDEEKERVKDLTEKLIQVSNGK